MVTVMSVSFKKTKSMDMVYKPSKTMKSMKDITSMAKYMEKESTLTVTEEFTKVNGLIKNGMVREL